jgi:hypothetical protein
MLNEVSQKQKDSWAPVAQACNPTQEADIRRIAVPSQSSQIVHETLPQKYPTQKGLVE